MPLDSAAALVFQQACQTTGVCWLTQVKGIVDLLPLLQHFEDCQAVRNLVATGTPVNRRKAILHWKSQYLVPAMKKDRAGMV